MQERFSQDKYLKIPCKLLGLIYLIQNEQVNRINIEKICQNQTSVYKGQNIELEHERAKFLLLPFCQESGYITFNITLIKPILTQTLHFNGTSYLQFRIEYY